MRHSILAIALLSIAFTNSAQAGNKASKEEVIGVGSGALIGAAAAGPFGFIAGAAFGALVGDKMHTKNEAIVDLSDDVNSREQELAQRDSQLRALHSKNNSLGAELDQLRIVARPELLELMQAGIAMDLLFKTDEAELNAETKIRLNAVASTLAAMTDVYVRLDGFADERGDALYNQSLSEKRVSSVRDQLIHAGIPADRIQMQAHGEVAAADATLDSFALKRKVSLLLYIDDVQAVAANP